MDVLTKIKLDNLRTQLRQSQAFVEEWMKTGYGPLNMPDRFESEMQYQLLLERRIKELSEPEPARPRIPGKVILVTIGFIGLCGFLAPLLAYFLIHYGK